MLITCKCLNVSISDENGHGTVNLEIEKLGLSSSEQRDLFFAERLGSACDWSVRCEETSLVESYCVGAWLVHRCLVCQTYTHAIFMQDTRQMLANTDLIVTEEVVEQLRRSEKYSPVFNMLVNQPSEELGARKGAVGELGRARLDTGNLSRKLTRALQAKVDAVEESVRLFREKQYAEFEQFRDRAHTDHRILSSFLFQSGVPGAVENTNRNLIPQGKDVIQQITPKSRHAPNFGSEAPPSSKPRNSNMKNTVNLDSYKEDSLDSEGIFDLEGTDLPNNGLNSDNYDSDSDDSVSRDEGIHITRDVTQQWGSAMAKSLPVNVPAFTQFHDISQDGLDQHEDEPRDIAASIKALARSVHRDDVFGDLPRPRFTTQI